MGYDLHITRRDHWAEEAEPGITIDEWLSLIASDPEMRLDGFAEARFGDGSVLRSEDPSTAVWIAHPDHGQRDGMAWLWLGQGNIVAKNPDDATIRKMWRIAQRLSARVQGDDGELYDSEAAVVRAQPEPPSMHARKKPWWRIW